MATLKPSRPTAGAALSLFSPADTLASPKATPGNAVARRMTVGSGQKCAVSIVRCGPAGSLAKMCMATSAWASTVCLLTWKPMVTKRGRLLFRLAARVPATSATACGLLPTPTTDCESYNLVHAKGGNFTLLGAVQLLPTPTVNDANNPDCYPSQQNRSAPGLAAKLGGRLNPHFVLQMMGFPADWCDVTAADVYAAGVPKPSAQRATP